MPKVTGAQIRAARSFLRWTISDLAERAGISEPTVKTIEAAIGEPAIREGMANTRDYRQVARADSIEKITRALVKAGITFLPDDGKGVGLRARIKFAKNP